MTPEGVREGWVTPRSLEASCKRAGGQRCEFELKRCMPLTGGKELGVGQTGPLAQAAPGMMQA